MISHIFSNNWLSNTFADQSGTIILPKTTLIFPVPARQTHTDRYLQFSSHYSRFQKLTIISKTLILCIIELTHRFQTKTNKNHTKRAFDKF